METCTWQIVCGELWPGPPGDGVLRVAAAPSEAGRADARSVAPHVLPHVTVESVEVVVHAAHVHPALPVCRHA